MGGNNGLPQGWVKVNLEECVDILDSQRIPINATERIERISGKTEESLFPYFGATGQVGWIDDFIFDEELVLLGEDGAPFLEGFKQKAYIIRGKTWVNNHAHVLRAINGVALNSYLKHYLDVFDYHEFVTGTTRLKLNQSQMRKIPVKLPPFPEQERIVARIEELFTQLDAGVAELQNAKAQLKRYRAAVLKSAVEGELTRDWREAHQGEFEPAEKLLALILSARRAKWTVDGGKGKYKEPAAPNTDDLPELPEGWVWANHDQLILELRNGFFGGRPATEPPGVPLLRISAVRPMLVSYDSLRYIRDIAEDKLETYQIQWGDLLFTRYNGNPNLVGACGMVRNVGEPTLYPDKLIRVVVPKELVKPEYLEIYFATNLARSFINPKIKSTAGQNGIAGGDLKDIPVIIPPLKEQQRIVEMVERRLSVADTIKKELDGAMVRAERLRGSVLKSAFEGRLV